MRFNKLYIYLLLVLAMGALSCEKEEVTIPPSLAHFTTASNTLSYFVRNDPNAVYKVPVGITTVSDKDRTINFSVTSPTGAASGKQYTIASNSIVIPAGKAVDSILVKGLFAGYPSGRKDTLVFEITGGDVTPADFGKTFNLVLQRYCDVNLSSLVGIYTQVMDLPDYGPYTIEVLSATSTGPTSGYIMVDNLWDVGGPSPVRIDLDWSDPSNFTTSVVSGQFLYTDPDYGTARVRPVGLGTFSSCDNTFTFKYQVYVSAGSFSATTTTVAR